MKTWLIKVTIPESSWEDTFLVYAGSVVEAEDILRRVLIESGIPKDKEMFFSNKTITTVLGQTNIGRMG